MPFERSDWKPESRKPISAKLFADLLSHAGMDKLIRVSLHADQIAGFYDCPVDALDTHILFGEYTIENLEGPFVVGTVDAGGNKRSERIQKFLEKKTGESIQMAYIDKQRPEPGVSEIRGIIGNVEGSNVIISEDIADTMGTMGNAAKAYEQKGAKEINAFSTVGLFSYNKKKDRPAAESMTDTERTGLRITDAKHVDPEHFRENEKWLKGEISVSEMLAQAIYCNQVGDSVSSLFEY